MLRTVRRKCTYMAVISMILVVTKMTVLDDKVLVWDSFGDFQLKIKDLLTNGERRAPQVFKFKQSYNKYSEDNKHQKIEGYKDFTIPDNWENTMAIMKLKQMIINNAKSQILVKRRFNI